MVPTLSGGPPQEKEEDVEHMAVLSAFTRISLTNNFPGSKIIPCYDGLHGTPRTAGKSSAGLKTVFGDANKHPRPCWGTISRVCGTISRVFVIIR